MSELITIGALADRLGVKIHQARYLIESRDIQPAGFAGRYRLFSENAVRQLEQEVSRATNGSAES